jgi:hypothetical protein
MNSGHHDAAQRLREANGTAGPEQALDSGVRALSRAKVPHLLIGGYAAQEYGCLCYMGNVNLIVPDIASVVAALVSSGFRPHPSSQMIVIDPETKCEVLFLLWATAETTVNTASSTGRCNTL